MIAHSFPGEDPYSGKIQVPDWVPKLLQAPESSIVQARVDQFCEEGWSGQHSGRDPYNVLLAYLSLFGVNHDQPIVPIADETADDPKSNARKVQGSLSSLWFDFSREKKQQEGNDVEMSSTGMSEMPGQDPGHEDESMLPLKANLRLGFGTARVQVNGKDVAILHRAKGHPVAGNGAPVLFREIHLFASEADTLQELMDTVLEWNRAGNKVPTARSGRYHLFTLVVEEGHAYWNTEGAKASRSLDSIILPAGMLDKIVEDFKEFSEKDTEEWYLAHGLPYRRSFLFHGPPGTGKTSTIRALAGTLKMPAYFLSLGDSNIGNSQLNSALRQLPKKVMLVVEDIDALFSKDRKSKNSSTLTFSGLLNALDGLISRDGTLTIMTTNDIDKLDAALMRAGRVDRKFEFNSPTYEQIVGLFKSFYPEAENDLATEFADEVFKRTEGDATSIATLQEHFIFTRRKTARESVSRLNEFFTEFYTQTKKRQTGEAHSQTKMWRTLK